MLRDTARESFDASREPHMVPFYKRCVSQCVRTRHCTGAQEALMDCMLVHWCQLFWNSSVLRCVIAHRRLLGSVNMTGFFDEIVQVTTPKECLRCGRHASFAIFRHALSIVFHLNANVFVCGDVLLSFISMLTSLCVGMYYSLSSQC